MKILVTAGNTRVMIDRVRCITNIFTGRTGAAIARHACARGHAVTLLTSHPEEPTGPSELLGQVDAMSWTVKPYRTFDDLQQLMETELSQGSYDALIHCAAVSDYRPTSVYSPASDTRFDVNSGRWQTSASMPAVLVDRTADKVKSDEPELWLRLTRTPKLVDRVRSDWLFRGILVKFKLEIGITDAELLAVAERSRRQSGADLMVANTLEGMRAWAYLGPVKENYQRITRRELACACSMKWNDCCKGVRKKWGLATKGDWLVFAVVSVTGSLQ